MNISQGQNAPAVLPRTAAAPAARARARRLLDATIFGALLALIALVAIPYGTVEPWWEAAFECVVFALTALWIIEELVGTGAWRLSEPRLLLPLLLLVGFAFVQTLPFGAADSAQTNLVGAGAWSALSADPYETRRFALKLLALVACGQLLLAHTSRVGRLRALVYTLIGVAAASALFGIIRQTMQRNPIGFVLPYLVQGSGYGQLINRNHFALLMEMALGLVLGLALTGGVRRERLLLHASLALPIWTALVLTTSRGGLLAMVSQLLFLALLYSFAPAPASAEPSASAAGARASTGPGRFFRSLAARVVLVACLVLAVGAGVVLVGGDQLMTRLENLPGEVSGVGAEASDEKREGALRIEVWRATLGMVRDHPVGGVGLGAYGVAITKYHHASGRATPEAAHNDYLELLASGGLVAVGLAVWFVAAFIRRTRAVGWRAADPFRRAACLGALVGLTGVAVHSLVDFGLHITINALAATVLLVIAVVDTGPARGRQPSTGRSPAPARPRGASEPNNYPFGGGNNN